MNNTYSRSQDTRSGYRMYNRSSFPHRLRMRFHIQRLAHTHRRLTGFAYLCDDARRTSPRAGRREGPPRVPSWQAGTAEEEANEKVHLERRKGLRGAEHTRISTPQRHDSGYATHIYYRYYQALCFSLLSFHSIFLIFFLVFFFRVALFRCLSLAGVCVLC